MGWGKKYLLLAGRVQNGDFQVLPVKKHHQVTFAGGA